MNIYYRASVLSEKCNPHIKYLFIIIVTFIIGIAIANIFRNYILKKPLSETKAGILSIVLCIVQIVFWAIVYPNRGYITVFLVSIIDFFILNKDYYEYKEVYSKMYVILNIIDEKDGIYKKQVYRDEVKQADLEKLYKGENLYIVSGERNNKKHEIVTDKETWKLKKELYKRGNERLLDGMINIWDLQ